MTLVRRSPRERLEAAAWRRVPDARACEPALCGRRRGGAAAADCGGAAGDAGNGGSLSTHGFVVYIVYMDVLAHGWQWLFFGGDLERFGADWSS
jgi:hypothetical protein